MQTRGAKTENANCRARTPTYAQCGPEYISERLYNASNVLLLKSLLQLANNQRHPHLNQYKMKRSQ